MWSHEGGKEEDEVGAKMPPRLAATMRAMTSPLFLPVQNREKTKLRDSVVFPSSPLSHIFVTCMPSSTCDIT